MFGVGQDMFKQQVTPLFVKNGPSSYRNKGTSGGVDEIQ